MPWTRHIMQSVTVPVVTQNRASSDYNPNNNQWQIGDSSILSHAVGLAPSKDVRAQVLGLLKLHVCTKKYHISSIKHHPHLLATLV